MMERRNTGRGFSSGPVVTLSFVTVCLVLNEQPSLQPLVVKIVRPYKQEPRIYLRSQMMTVIIVLHTHKGALWCPASMVFPTRQRKSDKNIYTKVFFYYPLLYSGCEMLVVAKKCNI